MAKGANFTRAHAKPQKLREVGDGGFPQGCKIMYQDVLALHSAAFRSFFGSLAVENEVMS